MRRSCELLSKYIPGASLATIKESAHFMIGTHPEEVARLIVHHVDRNEPAVKEYEQTTVRFAAQSRQIH